MTQTSDCCSFPTMLRKEFERIAASLGRRPDEVYAALLGNIRFRCLDGCAEYVETNPDALRPVSEGQPRPWGLVIQHGDNRESRLTLPATLRLEHADQVEQWLQLVHDYERRGVSLTETLDRLDRVIDDAIADANSARLA